MDKFMNLGGYPPQYDPVKHGMYDPARYYGKPDTAFAELKLKEIPAWLMRREKSPRTFMGMCSRGFWRWQHKYAQPQRAGVAPFFQVAVAAMIYFYVINYPKLRHHKNYKYH